MLAFDRYRWGQLRAHSCMGPTDVALPVRPMTRCTFGLAGELYIDGSGRALCSKRGLHSHSVARIRAPEGGL